MPRSTSLSPSSFTPSPTPRTDRGSALPVLLGVVLTAMLATGLAWTATAKTATLSVDGELREVAFRGSTVGDLLDAAGLSAGEHDLLVPSAEAPVEDGSRVALRRGREIELVVDGAPRRVWVTATSVEEALAQIGVKEQNLTLSASRSRGIPLEGFRLQVTTPKRITVIADNTTQERDSSAATVADVLTESGLVLDADDRMSSLASDPVTAGLVLRVTRIVVERVEEDVPLPFATEERPDASLLTGDTKELTAGKDGLARRTVERVLADGVLEKSTELASAPVAAPVSRVVAVGTKARPVRTAPAPAPAPRTGTAGADGLNWAALARCESGGNPRAVSSSGAYRGMYQFSLATWRGVGGSGDPIDATVEEQTYRAKLLYQRSGAGQWPSCGPRLFT